jgi:hypothetical protein
MDTGEDSDADEFREYIGAVLMGEDIGEAERLAKSKWRDGFFILFAREVGELEEGVC